MAQFSSPPVNFHFKVQFILPGVKDADMRFRDVSGLSMTATTTPLREGGENRFVYQLPTQVDFPDLELNRAMSTNSGVTAWVRAQLETFQFFPVDIIITLLNQNHDPLRSWLVSKAFPKSWEISKFDAMNQDYVVEKLVLDYQYFKVIDLDL